MSFADDLWLGAMAARRNSFHIMTYGMAFCGHATMQGLHLGLNAPRMAMSALARAANAPSARLLAAPVTAPPVLTLVESPAPEPVVAERAAIAPAPGAVAVAAPLPPQSEAGPDAEPAPEPAPEPALNPLLLDAPRNGQADDLTALSGVGAKLAATLNDFGIYHFDQIAGLDATGIDWINAQQPGFKALQARFDLIGQARARV